MILLLSKRIGKYSVSWCALYLYGRVGFTTQCKGFAYSDSRSNTVKFIFLLQRFLEVVSRMKKIVHVILYFIQKFAIFVISFVQFHIQCESFTLFFRTSQRYNDNQLHS